MHYACVQRFDVTGTVGIFLKIKQGLRFIVTSDSMAWAPGDQSLILLRWWGRCPCGHEVFSEVEDPNLTFEMYSITTLSEQFTESNIQRNQIVQTTFRTWSTCMNCIRIRRFTKM